MKIQIAVLTAMIFAGAPTAVQAAPLGTSFTYQGQLQSQGVPLTGTVDLKVLLFDVESGGLALDTLELDNISVTNGLFAVELDFGAETFNGDARWLEIALRSPHDPGDTLAFTTLAPRQPLKATPYALQTRGLFVDNAGNVGIGTTTPMADLHVQGDGALGELIVSPGVANSSAQIRMSENTSAGLGAIMRYDGTTNQWQVIGKISGGETMPHLVVGRDNGRVGIGTTTPASQLSVAGDVTVLTGTGVETIRLDAFTGGTGGGAVLVRDQFGTTTVEIEGSEGNGGGSYIKMWNSDAVQTIELDADEVNGGVIRLKNLANQTTIELLSDIGGEGRLVCDVIQIKGGSDLSEQFDVSSTGSKIEPGMVVSIDPANAGKLMVCHEAYDKKVAGIISGAGGVKPGLLMGQEGSIADGQYPIALTGRAWCHVDASFGKIYPGDLLTTSSTVGHAMKAGDSDRGRGAIIGKAMTSLESGKGLVLVLVQPQ